MCAARFKTLFPLAVHIVGNKRHGGKPTISQQYPPTKLSGEGPQGERQGKSFTKPFKWTLVLVFLTYKSYLLSHINRWGFSEIVDIHPLPHKIVPPRVRGRNLKFDAKLWESVIS